MFQLLVNGVQGEFALLDQQQLGRCHGQNLAAQLAADGTSRSRHQHHLTHDVLGQQDVVGRHGLAAQQVVDVQFPQVRDAHLALRQIGHAGQGAHGHAGAADLVQDFVASAAREAGHGQQHVADVTRGRQIVQIGRVVNGQAVEHVAMQAIIVVQEAHHLHFVAVGHGGGQLAAGGACAVDQHLGARRTLEDAQILLTQPDPDQRARSAHEQQQQNRLDDAHRARHPVHANGGENGGIQQAIDAHRTGHRQQRGPAAVAENGAVQARDDEDGQRDAHGSPHRPQRRARQRHKLAQPQIESQPNSEYAEPQINGQGYEALCRAWQGQD